MDIIGPLLFIHLLLQAHGIYILILYLLTSSHIIVTEDYPYMESSKVTLCPCHTNLLPAGGVWNNTNYKYKSTDGCYWSTTLHTSYAYNMSFTSNVTSIYSVARQSGLSVRARHINTSFPSSRRCSYIPGNQVHKGNWFLLVKYMEGY